MLHLWDLTIYYVAFCVAHLKQSCPHRENAVAAAAENCSVVTFVKLAEPSRKRGK